MSRMLQALKQLDARGVATSPAAAVGSKKTCHPERSEGSAPNPAEILRCAQDDRPESTTFVSSPAPSIQSPPCEQQRPDPASQKQPIARCDLGSLFGRPSMRQHREYRRTAEHMFAQLPPDRSAVLMFVGMADGDEAAIVGLSAVLAEQGSGETLLVDGNFRCPMLSDPPVLRGRRSLLDVLLGSVAWRDAVSETDVPHLHFLRGDRFSGDGRPPQDLRFGPLLAELRRQYRLVLVRTETATPAEFAQLARHCDAAYLFLQLHRTPRETAQNAIRRIVECGGQVLGCVVTGA